MHEENPECTASCNGTKMKELKEEIEVEDEAWHLALPVDGRYQGYESLLHLADEKKKVLEWLDRVLLPKVSLLSNVHLFVIYLLRIHRMPPFRIPSPQPGCFFPISRNETRLWCSRLSIGPRVTPTFVSRLKNSNPTLRLKMENPCCENFQSFHAFHSQ
jgi:hypothetical protein